MSKVEYATKEDIIELRKEIGIIKKAIANRLFDEVNLSKKELEKIKKILEESKYEEYFDLEEI